MLHQLQNFHILALMILQYIIQSMTHRGLIASNFSFLVILVVMFLTMNGILDEILYLNYMITATKVLLFRVNNASYLCMENPIFSMSQ